MIWICQIVYLSFSSEYLLIVHKCVNLCVNLLAFLLTYDLIWNYCPCFLWGLTLLSFYIFLALPFIWTLLDCACFIEKTGIQIAMITIFCVKSAKKLIFCLEKTDIISKVGKTKYLICSIKMILCTVQVYFYHKLNISSFNHWNEKYHTA